MSPRTLVIAAVLAAFPIEARPLSNLELYRRCFGQLTGQRLDLHDPLTQQVVAGTLAPLDACAQVLESAVLSATDSATQGRVLPQGSPRYAQAVLANMHKLHASFFQVKDFIPADGLRPTRSKGTMDFFDNSTPALYLTRTLLSPKAGDGTLTYPFTSIVTGNDLLGAVRTEMDPSAGPRTGYPKAFYAVTGGFRFAPIGALLGIRALTPSTVSFTMNQGGGAADAPDQYTDFTVPLNGTQVRDGSIGGGVLGNYVYVMLNVQGAVDFDKYDGADTNGLPKYLSVDFQSNGALRMPRKWGRAVFHDFLCRDLPVVRVGDGDAFLSTNTASPPFRQSSTCLTCHSSIDRASAVVRHVVYRGFGTGPEYGHPTYPATAWFRGFELVDFKGTSGSAPFSWPETGDTGFSAQNPAGVLFYRDHTGTLVDTPVTGVDSLGAALAAQDDFYICAAQRYFRHFTGISANIGDVDPSTLSMGDQAARNAVIGLGQSLRMHGSLRQLVKDIFALPLYRDSSYLVAP
jgi:hypothetical protein